MVPSSSSTTMPSCATLLRDMLAEQGYVAGRGRERTRRAGPRRAAAESGPPRPPDATDERDGGAGPDPGPLALGAGAGHHLAGQRPAASRRRCRPVPRGTSPNHSTPWRSPPRWKKRWPPERVSRDAMAEYWIGDAEGRVLGPVSLDVVQDLVNTGRLTQITRASRDGQSWGPPHAYPEVMALLLNAPPPEALLNSERQEAARVPGAAAGDAGAAAARDLPAGAQRLGRRVPECLLQAGEAVLPGPGAGPGARRPAQGVRRRLPVPQPADGSHRARARRRGAGLAAAHLRAVRRLRRRWRTSR